MRIKAGIKFIIKGDTYLQDPKKELQNWFIQILPYEQEAYVYELVDWVDDFVTKSYAKDQFDIPINITVILHENTYTIK